MNRASGFHSMLRAFVPLLLLLIAYAVGRQWFTASGLRLPPIPAVLGPMLAACAGILSLAAYQHRREGQRLGVGVGLLLAAALELQGPGQLAAALSPAPLGTSDPTLAAVLVLATCLWLARILTGWDPTLRRRRTLVTLGASAGLGATAPWVILWLGPLAAATLLFLAGVWAGRHRRNGRFDYWLWQAGLWGTVLGAAALATHRTVAGGGVDILYALLLFGAWRDLAPAPATDAKPAPEAAAMNAMLALPAERLDEREWFAALLEPLCALTSSPYGILGEVVYPDHGRPRFSLRGVMTDGVFDLEAMEVDDPQTALGRVCAAGAPLVRNGRCDEGPERGLPPGHPAIDSLLVIPLHAGGELVGVAALANRRHGYSQADAERLRPLASLCGLLMRARGDARGRRAAQAAVRGNLAAMEASVDGMAIVDEDGRYTYANRALARLHGVADGAQLLGRTWRSLYDERELERFGREILPPFMAHRHWRGECIGRRADGSTFPQELSLTAMPDGGMVFVVRDITERKLAEGRIHHLANYDALTGLPNRRLLHERVGRALVQARRAGRILAVLFIDLDHFKPVNDTLGHEAGDALLKAVGSRLAGAVRESDVVARIGGDEFVVALTNLAHERDAVVVVEKLRAALAAPLELEGRSVRVAASIGVSLYPGDGTEIDVLIRKADDAMYRAKAAGRATYSFHGQAVAARVNERLNLERSLRRAVDHGEFALHYLPTTDIGACRPIGLEALLRWDHPELGRVLPSNFLPFAEESGLIGPIGAWVLEEVCRRARALTDHGVRGLHLALNLSTRQFLDPTLVQMLGDALQRAGADPCRLAVDVAERTLSEPADPKLARTLGGLRELGVRLHLDNYGTGAVTAPQLRRYAPQALKIDRSFVRKILKDPDCVVVVTAIVAMAKPLGIDVIAEGVESAEQLARLRELRCDGVQGHYVSKPLDWEDTLRWVSARPAGAASRAG